MRAPALWLPLDLDRARERGVSAVVRLSPRAAVAEAETWLGASGILRPSGDDQPVVDVDLIPLAEMLTGDVRTPLLLLLGAVGFVMALVGANVATMLLARASAREREVAIRRAIGATRRRLFRQLLAESLVLAVIGGTIGVLLAWWSISVMPLAAAGVLPRLNELGLDSRVLLFSLGVVPASGVLAGLVPAVVGSRASPFAAMKGAFTGDRDWARVGGVRSGLVIAQVTLSVALLVGAGLMVKSFLTIMPSDPGFDPSGRLAMAIRLDGRPRYDEGGRAQRLAFVEQVTRRIESLPGVKGVAATSFLPLIMMSSISEVHPGGRAAESAARATEAHNRAVTANYFSIMRIPLIRGRAFTEADAAGAERVVIVNETAARRWWPDGEALGRRIGFTEDGERAEGVVVGVVGDVRFSGLRTSASAELFVPYAQNPYQMMTFVVATTGDPRGMIPHVRREVRVVDPLLPIRSIEAMEDIVGASVAIPRFYAGVPTGFAVVALVLALTGIFGVLAYAVSQRQREIGIRLALGAAPSEVRRSIVRQGMTIALAGVVLGALVARGMSRVLANILFEVSPIDGNVFAAMLALVACAALAACLVPAHRAARVNPLVAIKGE